MSDDKSTSRLHLINFLKLVFRIPCPQPWHSTFPSQLLSFDTLVSFVHPRSQWQISQFNPHQSIFRYRPQPTWVYSRTFLLRKVFSSYLYYFTPFVNQFHYMRNLAPQSHKPSWNAQESCLQSTLSSSNVNRNYQLSNLHSCRSKLVYPFKYRKSHLAYSCVTLRKQSSLASYCLVVRIIFFSWLGWKLPSHDCTRFNRVSPDHNTKTKGVPPTNFTSFQRII